MRQKDRCQTGKVFWLIFLEPKNLGGGKARENCIANGSDGLFEPTKLLHYLFTLCGCRGIAPELCRPDHLSVLIQWDEAVLLSAHPNRFHFRRNCPGLSQGTSNAAG